MAKSILFLAYILLLVSSSCAISTNPAAHFIYVGCSIDKYSSNTSYAQTLDRLLTSINNSAPYKPYNTFSIKNSNPPEEMTAFYQCRGDISMPDCTDCVLEAVSELRQLCFRYSQGVIQMEGCSVRYDNTTFLGQQDTNVQLRKCGPHPSSGNTNDLKSQREKVLDGLLKSSQFYRISKSEDNNIQSRAQCMGDLSPDQCQQCVTEAIRITKRECYSELAYGDMFLGKCYVRYTIDHTDASHRGCISRTAKILIVIGVGLSTGLVLLSIYEGFHKWASSKGKNASQKQPK